MALGILGAYGGISRKEVPDYVFVGELSLDGGVRGIRGALPIAVAARAGKIPNLIVPVINAKEAAVVSGVNVYPVTSLHPQKSNLDCKTRRQLQARTITSRSRRSRFSPLVAKRCQARLC